MRIRQIHHVAYRCNDTKETVDLYERALGMRFLLAISEDRVPSTKEPEEELKALGIDTVGPTDHSIIKSIYFFDPNGHRLELTVPTASDATLAELNALAPEMPCRSPCTRPGPSRRSRRESTSCWKSRLRPRQMPRGGWSSAPKRRASVSLRPFTAAIVGTT